MQNKQQILTTISDEFNLWEDMLSKLSDDEATHSILYEHITIKDMIAHLWAWQQRSIARMQAAVSGTEPQLPVWIPGIEDINDENTNRINAWIYEAYKDQSWSTVHQNWRNGFLRLIELAEAVPEADLLETGKYPWLADYALGFILTSSYEHHHIDHLSSLEDWMREHGKIQ